MATKFNPEKLIPFMLPAAIVSGGLYVVYKLTGGDGGQSHSNVNPDGLTVNKSNFKSPAAVYEHAAERSYKIMNGTLIESDQELLDLVKGMNADELKEVYRIFGKRSGSIGIPLVNQIKIGKERDLIEWYAANMGDHYLTGNKLSQMKAIWKPTKLWN